MPRYSAHNDVEFDMLVNQHGGYPRVLLNGIEQDAVVVVDTDEGWIERSVLDRDGKYVIVADECKVERVHGHVQLIWPDTRYI